MTGSRVVLIAAATLCFSCTMGPNYNRPALTVPDAYRDPSVQSSETLGASSLGDTRWADVFLDAELQRLLTTALDRNYDIRIAATRIDQAAANAGIVRADQFPNVSVDAGFNRTKSSAAERPSSRASAAYIRALPASPRRYPGLWISGVNIAVPPNRRARSCWRRRAGSKRFAPQSSPP